MHILGANIIRGGRAIDHLPINRTINNEKWFRKIYTRYVKWKYKSKDIDFSFVILDAPVKPKHKRFEDIQDADKFNKEDSDE